MMFMRMKGFVLVVFFVLTTVNSGCLSSNGDPMLGVDLGPAGLNSETEGTKTGPGTPGQPSSPGPTPSPSSSSSPNPGSSPVAVGVLGDDHLDVEELAFLQEINSYRAQNGLYALKASDLLNRISQWMSTDMATKNYFNHTDSLGRDPFKRMEAFGFAISGYAGENIAAGNASAADTFSQWKNSPDHNANMLDPHYAQIGIGRAYSSGSKYGWYWTTDFSE